MPELTEPWCSRHTHFGLGRSPTAVVDITPPLVPALGHCRGCTLCVMIDIDKVDNTLFSPTWKPPGGNPCC
jgi:hypothetical protein